LQNETLESVGDGLEADDRSEIRPLPVPQDKTGFGRKGEIPVGINIGST
jgi:hypothetical protein